jgi:hypothetical protein
VAFSSANHQGFVVGAGTTLAATMTVTDDLFRTITAVNDIRVRIPAVFPMRWDGLQSSDHHGLRRGKGPEPGQGLRRLRPNARSRRD